MIAVIIGGELQERAKRRRALAGKIALEELDAAIAPEELASLAGTLTLTGERRAFFLRGALAAEGEEGEARRDVLLELVAGLAESPHLFVFEEEKLLKAERDALKKAGAQVEELQKPEKKEKLNVFALADALGQRDRKKLWLLLRAALREGIQPENLAGILSWKARAMLAAARTPDERERLSKISRGLVALYHESHRGAGDLGLLLERFVLNV